MTAIFLSYRRTDTGGYAGRLADAHEERFGKGSGRLETAIRKLTQRGPADGRRRVFLLAGAGAAIGAMAAAAYVMLSRPADVSGRWNLPDGSFWIVVPATGPPFFPV